MSKDSEILRCHLTGAPYCFRVGNVAIKAKVVHRSARELAIASLDPHGPFTLWRHIPAFAMSQLPGFQDSLPLLCFPAAVRARPVLALRRRPGLWAVVHFGGLQELVACAARGHFHVEVAVGFDPVLVDLTARARMSRSALSSWEMRMT